MDKERKGIKDVNVGPVERALCAAAGAALAAYGMRRRGWARGVSLAAGGDLLLRGLTGHSFLYDMLGTRTAGQARDHKGGIKVSEFVTVNRPPEDLYRLWRDFENLPRIMRHVQSVEVEDEKRSHWKVNGPAGVPVEWDAEIVRDIPDKLITWQTLNGARVVHAGSVSFERVPGGAGTEVRVVLRYDPPGGALGAAVAGALGEDPARQVREDLGCFKRRVESGQGLSIESLGGVSAG